MSLITRKRFYKLVVFIVILIVFFSGCGDTATETDRTPPKTGKAQPNPQEIVFAYDGWSGTWLSVFILKTLFEEKLGYKTKIYNFNSVPGAFDAVANGRADIYTSAWFPARNDTLDKYSNLVTLGQVYGGKAKDAYEGWMISAHIANKYRINHVKDLLNKNAANELDIDGNGKGDIISCPKDWVCAKRNPEILADFGLAGMYELIEIDSEDELVKTVEKRLKNNKPTLFYMLQPVAFPDDLSMSKQALWLKGTEAYLPLSFNRTIVRNDFFVWHPEAAQILSRYKISGTEISQAMAKVAEKGDSSKYLSYLAREWIDNHKSEVDSWLRGITNKRETPPSPDQETLTVAYSPEKEDLFLQLVILFNRTRPKDRLPIQPVKLNMADMLEKAMNGKFSAISPDSSVWLAQLDRMWQKKKNGSSPIVGHRVRYAMSPIVIAMWESKASALGYPGKSIGWHEIMKKASSDRKFRWSHSSVTTASGLLATTAEFYAGAGKRSSLTKADLTSKPVIDYVKKIEGTVERYGGESEDRMVIRMLAEGGYPLDAFVAQEQMVIFFNRNTTGERLVAIYPKEGTFWMDHPLVLLDGPWVTEAQNRTFREFAAFVMKSEQQKLVLQMGYRPADVSTSLQSQGSLIKPEYNVEPKEPKMLLKVPTPGIVSEIRELWFLTKKPANIYLVVDVSGSMTGEKLSGAKTALMSFITQIKGENDRVALVAFSDVINEVQGLGPCSRSSLRESIQNLSAFGGTKLYDAIAYACNKLKFFADANRTNVIVAMTDGVSSGNISVIESNLRQSSTPVLIFNVAYGADADLEVLQRIARLGKGRAYASDPETVGKLYKLISKFF